MPFHKIATLKITNSKKFSMKLLSNVVNKDPEILGGIPVFLGTCVPIKTFFDYLEAGDSLLTFLEHFPSVQREQGMRRTSLTGIAPGRSESDRRPRRDGQIKISH